MHRHRALQELDIAHQARQVIGEKLDRRHRADAAGVERRGMHVASFHQAEHLARVAADLQGFAIELALERIDGLHDVADGAIAVRGGSRRFGLDRLLPQAGIGLAHHALAEINCDQVFLEDVVIEHVLGRFAKIHDPFAEMRRLHAIGHVLRIAGASRVIVAADSADATRDEMRVARILALHEDAVAAEYRRGAITLRDLLLAKVDLGINSEAADDSGDRIPIHLDQAIGRLRRHLNSPSS